MSIRFWIALWFSKLYRFGIRLVGKDGSATPGMLAIKICPDFLGRIKKPEKIICITGTNGKTTTSNLVTSVLRKAGYSVTNNSTGSNVQGGVATALLADTTLLNKPKNQLAVLEVDERSSLLVYRYITPDYLLCNNIMRDSLKRNAHTDFISYVLNKALPASTHVILNADDFITCRLFPENQNRTYFGISWDAPADKELKSRDIVYCPNCGKKLSAEYVRYDHIGRFFCSGCGLSSPKPDYEMTCVDDDYFTIAHNGKTLILNSINNNIINYYNCVGAAALLCEMGVSADKIQEAFRNLEIVKTRYNVTQVGELRITMQMAKGENPAATARSYAYIASLPGQNKLMFIMNDDKEDNILNVENTCWLYDTDHTGLLDASIGHIIFAGKRCLDRRLGAELAGVDPKKIECFDSFYEAAREVDLGKYQDIYVLYDNYLTDEAQRVTDILAKRGENQ